MRNPHTIDLDDATTQRLIQIAQSHCKLALEHSKANTLPDRREAIRSEIKRLRAERDELISRSNANFEK